MRLPAYAAGSSTRRLLSLLAAALIATLLAGPVAAEAAETPSSTEAPLVAQEATTSSTPSMGQTTVSSPTSFGELQQGGESGQTAIVPPLEGQVALNPGWRTDQMDIRVWPEFDQKAVLVIVGFSLPADVTLPATLKFPIPAGAIIAGIGEVDPNGSFTYNYADSYPPVEPGSEWDIATIEVKNHRQLQVDYYYDPGLPQDAGQRSFPILVQMPVDSGTLLLHVQQPARATDFEIRPALQGSGQADDGFTYSVATYSDVKAGSTLGYLVSYYKPDGGLSIDSGQSSPTQFNTTTVLLAAILVIVVIVGALIVYRLYSNSRGAGRQGGRPGARPSSAGAAQTMGTKRQRQRQANGASKGTTGKGATGKGAAGKRGAGKGAARKGATSRDATPKDERTEPAAEVETGVPEEAEPEQAEPRTTTDAATETGEEAVEYCIACGEELTTDSPFCPSCGEARP